MEITMHRLMLPLRLDLIAEGQLAAAGHHFEAFCARQNVKMALSRTWNTGMLDPRA
jgi:hypothetical protein